MVTLYLKTRKDITDWSIGHELLRALAEAAPSLRPQQAANYHWDSFRDTGIEIGSLDDCAPLWGRYGVSFGRDGSDKPIPDAFIWRRKKHTRCDGEADWHSRTWAGEFIPAKIMFSSSWDKEADWFPIFRRWCEICEPYVGYANNCVDGDGFDNRPIFRLGDPLRHGEGPRYRTDIRIGYLPWCLFLGEEFAKLMDAPALRAAGFQVDDIASGHLLRITDKPPKTPAQFRKFHEARERAAAHVDPSILKRLRRKYPDADPRDRAKAEALEEYDPRES